MIQCLQSGEVEPSCESGEGAATRLAPQADGKTGTAGMINLANPDVGWPEGGMTHGVCGNP
jgi:hypothetical protein